MPYNYQTKKFEAKFKYDISNYMKPMEMLNLHFT